MKADSPRCNEVTPLRWGHVQTSWPVGNLEADPCWYSDRLGRDYLLERAADSYKGVVVPERSVIPEDVRLHVVERGEGPVVLLIHGFSETSYVWRHQLSALANAGYRTVAFDVLGYGRSSKPANVEDYRMVKLVGDATA